MNDRKTALDILYKTINNSSYSNLLMRLSLNDSNNTPFITNLVYGVLENYYFLKYQISDLYKTTSKYNEIILIMSLYEKFYLNKEDYITINEYVKLAKSSYDKSFINAILHKVTNLKKSTDDYINYNLPYWIYNLLIKQYSKDEFDLILKNLTNRKRIYYRINHNKITYDDLNNIQYKIINEDFFISDNNLLKTKEFNDGYFYIQDINSSQIINSLDLKSDDIFLDACCAPGSKLFNSLDYVECKNAYANDINKNRLNLVKNKANILGYDAIHYSCFDASELNKHFNFEFDKILLDVPCSGLGVLARKPDIKFHLKDTTLDSLQIIQKNILSNVSKLCKLNGLICYSTCTLNKKENSLQIDNFLKENTNFIRIKEKTIFDDCGDMFYYCVLKRII